jgi:S-adenosylmethionine/arginine decarboxylase-like enzyme
MGHPDNVTTLTFKQLGKKYKKTEPQARQWVYEYLNGQSQDEKFSKNEDIEEMFKKAAKAWGQTVKDAKRQTFNMLKSEL